MPRFEDFKTKGLKDFTREHFVALQKIDANEWHQEVISQEEFFIKLWDHLPKEMVYQRELLISRL